jgi:hypothetical protein
MENRWIAVNHPQEVAAKLKSKKTLTAEKQRFYRHKTGISEILTGQ